MVVDDGTRRRLRRPTCVPEMRRSPVGASDGSGFEPRYPAPDRIDSIRSAGAVRLHHSNGRTAPPPRASSRLVAELALPDAELLDGELAVSRCVGSLRAVAALGGAGQPGRLPHERSSRSRSRSPRSRPSACSCSRRRTSPAGRAAALLPRRPRALPEAPAQPRRARSPSSQAPRRPSAGRRASRRRARSSSCRSAASPRSRSSCRPITRTRTSSSPRRRSCARRPRTRSASAALIQPRRRRARRRPGAAHRDRVARRCWCPAASTASWCATCARCRTATSTCRRSRSPGSAARSRACTASPSSCSGAATTRRRSGAPRRSLLARYGLQYETPNPQNVLVQLDASAAPDRHDRAARPRRRELADARGRRGRESVGRDAGGAEARDRRTRSGPSTRPTA